MTNNPNIDRLAEESLKNSLLELTDPEFNRNIMTKVMRENRRQRILQNFIFCFFVFIAVDTLILIFLWLTGLDIFDIAFKTGNISQNLLQHIGTLMDIILHNVFIRYLFLLITLLAIVGEVSELKFGLLGRKKK